MTHERYFKSGDRVKISARGRAADVCRRENFSREGTIACTPRASWPTVSVLWDGLKSHQSLHRSYVEFVSIPGRIVQEELTVNPKQDIHDHCFIEGYSCEPEGIAYRATDRLSGVTVERRGDPATHAPERFPENLKTLLADLEQKVRESYRAREATQPQGGEA